MSMQFTIALTGDISSEVEASDLGIDTDNPNDLLDVSSQVDFEDVRVSGTVTIEASVRISDVEVAAADLSGYDADTAIGEYVSPYGGCDVSNADFEVTDEPTGFDTVVEALGYDRDQAIEVYAALDRAGYEVR
jgi:hypothetical protein